MSYRARAYPYPVLSSFSHDFGPDARFSASIEPMLNAEDEQLVSIEFEVAHSSTWLDEYRIDGKAKLVLDVECRSTLFRQYFDLDRHKGRIDFASGQLYGSVSATPLLVATEDNDHYQPVGIDAEFGGARFSVRTGDILGVGDSLSFDLEFSRTLERDLITIEYSPALQDVYTFVYSGPRIIVKAGVNLQDPIGHMRKDASLNPYLYMSIYKDCIAGALNFLASESDDEGSDRPWSRALLRKLEELDPPRSLDPSDPAQQEITAQLLVAGRGVRKLEVSDV